MNKLLKQHRETLLALGAALLCLGAAFLVWLAVIRPNADKNLSEKISDDYTAATLLEEGGTVSQTFSTDSDLLALAFVFSIPGEQPSGTLELMLADADTGETLAASTGEMAYILSGQYTGLGLDRPVEGREGGRYRVTLTPRYEGAGRLAICHSASATLWDEEMTVNGQPQDATISLIANTRRIGGFLTRFFLLVSLAACCVLFFGVRAALRKKLALHRLVFVLVLCFGLLYCLVLPPYAVPDEKYHINQSFTMACQWANRFSPEDWKMGLVPVDTSYRREHDVNWLIQDENTTVFTWQETIDKLFTTTPDRFDSHRMLEELQTDTNPLLYLASTLGVFVGYLLRLGFVPTLMLGRLANLVLFAALAALAVRRAPFGKRLFAAAALLPMTLHLAASFSRDSVLLGLCFAFTALMLDAVCGDGPLPRRELALLAAMGLLLAPGKSVYLPLAALVLLIPGARLVRHANIKKAAYLIACLALTLAMNSSVLLGAVTTVDAAPAQPEQTAGVHGQPVPVNADYEATLHADTADNFVRRLYFYFEENDSVPQNEVDFWVQALREGDISAAELAQSFAFSPAEMETTRYDDSTFISALSLSMIGYDTMQTGEAARSLEIVGEGGRSLIFKAIYSRADFKQSCMDWGAAAGTEDADHYPLDRALLKDRVEARRATRASQSVAADEDLIRYSPSYILRHLPETMLLVVRSIVENTDHYLRTLVGGSLSYYSVELAWTWVVALYLLLAFAAFPAQDELPLPVGAHRGWLAAAALGCCALAVAGCITWTPVSHTTIYGLQGRYFLPVLPLLLLTCLPRRLTVPKSRDAAAPLVCGLCLVNVGVLINTMLVVTAR